MEHNIFEQDGKTYLRIGDKAIPLDGYDENGKPIIKAESEDFINEHGIPSKRAKVNCLTIQSIKT